MSWTLIVGCIRPGTYQGGLPWCCHLTIIAWGKERAKLWWQKSNIKFSAVLFFYFLEGFNFSEKSRAAKKRNQILYATWWSTYSQGFSASIFPDRGHTYVSDIYHCYIHYFSLLSREHKTLNFNGTVIHRSSTHYFFAILICSKNTKIFRNSNKIQRFEIHRWQYRYTMLQKFSLLSREYKNLSNRNKNKDLKYTFS